MVKSLLRSQRGLIPNCIFLLLDAGGKLRITDEESVTITYAGRVFPVNFDWIIAADAVSTLVTVLAVCPVYCQYVKV